MLAAKRVVIIRCSALTQYPDCPRRGAARLFWSEIGAAGFRLRSPARSIAAAVGRAVHKAAEVTLKEKAVSGRLPPSTVAADCAAESVIAQVKEGVDFDQATRNQTEAEVQSVMMARAYHRVIAPMVEPIIVEERLEAELGPSLVLSGQPDLVCREPNKIRDVKTSVRPRGTHAPQIGGYSLLARSNGLEIEEAAVELRSSASPSASRSPTWSRRRLSSPRPRPQLQTSSAPSSAICRPFATATTSAGSCRATLGRFSPIRNRCCARQNTARPLAPNFVTRATRQRNGGNNGRRARPL